MMTTEVGAQLRHLRSNAPGATVNTTTRLATISAKVSSDTKKMLPLDAGNLPRIT